MSESTRRETKDRLRKYLTEEQINPFVRDLVELEHLNPILDILDRRTPAPATDGEAIRWYPFDPALGSRQKLPGKYQPVLVRVPANPERGTPEGIAVGYLKFGAGDPESPYFVTPGIGGDIEAWCDVLPWREVEGRNAVYELWEASKSAALDRLAKSRGKA